MLEQDTVSGNCNLVIKTETVQCRELVNYYLNGLIVIDPFITMLLKAQRQEGSVFS